MKRKLRLFYFGLMCLFMFSTVLNAKAKETNSEDSYAFITASYSSNITPQEGDTFVITYKVYNGEDTAEITLDAYSICKNKVEIPLPEGTYEITDISYTGNNQAITSYAIKSIFNSSSNEDIRDSLTLAIGLEKTESLRNKYQDVWYMGGISDQELSDANNPKTYDELYNEKLQEEQQSTTQAVQDTTDTYTEDENYSDDYGVEEQKPTGEDPKIEVYSTTEENKTEEVKDNKSNNKIFIIIIVIVILAIVIFKFGSKPKSRR